MVGAAGSPADTKPAAFEVAGATFAVEGRTLLAPLSLGIAPGRFHGLIGHNGSGKSTFLKLLGRQEAPSGGAIRLGGVPLPDWGSRAFARAVAYLPQQTPPATVAAWRRASAQAAASRDVAAQADRMGVRLTVSPASTACVGAAVASQPTLLDLRQWLAQRWHWRQT